jgi:hypothetical protein
VDELDEALLSRFVQVTVVPDQQHWLQWAEHNGVHQAVLNYVKADPTLFQEPNSNPRAWHYVSDVLHAAKREESARHTLLVAISGLVGPRRAEAFLSSLEGTEHPCSADEVLSEYGQHRDKVASWIERGRLDLVEITVRALMTYIQPQAEFDGVAAHRPSWRNLARFLWDLPGDLREKAERLFSEREYRFPKRPTDRGQHDAA